MLKKIECIIQPFKLEEVKEALRQIAVEGMTVTEVRGCGRQKGYLGKYTADTPIHLLPKVKLEKAIRKYQNRALEAAQVIEELIELAKQMRQAQRRGDDLGMTDDEIAFYDALEVNDSAVRVLGDKTLKNIAQELVAAVRRSVTIDWAVRENARAQIRVIVKRILRKYGYPPDKQKKATQTVLEQAEVLCQEWVSV